ncbi:hypothetical protein EON63_04410 [archaeon]|nr:MAG: hypothetical protein EON63_04410 [archaeon]
MVYCVVFHLMKPCLDPDLFLTPVVLRRYVYIQTFGKMNFVNTVLSKRKLTWFVEQKLVEVHMLVCDELHDATLMYVLCMFHTCMSYPYHT